MSAYNSPVAYKFLIYVLKGREITITINHHPLILFLIRSTADSLFDKMCLNTAEKSVKVNDNSVQSVGHH